MMAHVVRYPVSAELQPNCDSMGLNENNDLRRLGRG